eukprot:9201208-Prorocentrum_lima.AAC.1
MAVKQEKREDAPRTSLRQVPPSHVKSETVKFERAKIETPIKSETQSDLSLIHISEPTRLDVI